jgi:TolB-like protein
VSKEQTRSGIVGCGTLVLLPAIILLFASHAAAATNVAVFNFQMKSDTPDWKWLEKGLADRIATDFVQDRALTVVARDEMQLLAQKMNWVPEMAKTDPKRMKEIQKQLKIEQLIGGVYAVANGRIRITGQIVDVESRTELARKEVEGPAEQVLDLQRQLSAELLAWFSKQEPAKILETLPVWTRSLPAMRALYEGMDLYDQGRYGEGWVKFRQASRDDPQYVEAVYWMGKMYYFMNRYEHARRSFEHFVYLDTGHPRVQDAIREYLHTYEQLNTPPETLLALYSDFQQRFPVDYAQTKGYPTWMLENHLWLEGRTALVLKRMGRYPEAINAASVMAIRFVDCWRAGLLTESAQGWAEMMQHIGRISLQDYNQLTGQVLLPEGMTVDSYWGETLFRFAPGHTEARWVPPVPYTISPHEVDGRPHYGLSSYFISLLVAEDGKMFKKISVYPEIEGEDGMVCTWLTLKSHKDGGESWLPVTVGKAKGIHFTDVPRTGVIELMLTLVPKDEWRDPKLALRAVRVVVELEDVPPNAGAVEVTCSNASTFYLWVDGRRCSCRAGLVGMLSPGEHRVEVRRFGWPPTPFADYKQTFQVEAGKTTRVDITLSWKPDSPLSGWTSPSLIGRDYAEESPNLGNTDNSPILQVDGGAIRVFWPHQGDLYMAQSTDGEHFSKPLRLPLPISSAWCENTIRCIRDESGRFILLFRSNRNGLRAYRLYVCWSRDGMHWSNPAMVLNQWVGSFDIVQNEQGHFVLAGFLWDKSKGGMMTILVSRDLYRWEQWAQWSTDLDQPVRADETTLLLRHDGTYQVSWAAESRGADEDYYHVYCRASKDGRTWSETKELLRLRGQDWPSVSLLEVEGRTLLGILWRNVFKLDTPMIQFIRENEDGTWQQGSVVYGIGSIFGNMTWNPRWGYVVVWTERPAPAYDVWDEQGPFLIRSQSVDAFFAEPEKPEKGKKGDRP